MPRKLFILRHGEAEVDRKWNDFDRPLTSSGKHTIRQVGQRLNGREQVDFILSSAAKRTRETSSIITLGLGYEPVSRFDISLYNAPLNVVKRALEQIEADHQAVLLVGHNPSLSYLVDYLSGKGHFSLDPGQLVAFELLIDSWNEISKGCGIILGS